MQSAAYILCWTLVGICGLASAQSAGSWLDRPAMNWNRRMGALPRPVSSGAASEIQTRCRDLIRQPENPAENALVRAGWRLYGDVRYYGPTKIVTAFSGVDGMCRPLGYQAFVYWEGRYAGTLSPAPMDSRTDGALVNTRLISPSRIAAEFVRYNASDPLCCPTRISYVMYEVSRDDAPLVAPVNINTSTVGAPAGGPDAGRDDSDDSDDAALYGRKWALIEVNGAAVRTGNPYVEFDREAKRFSGDSGCNRISGGFEVNGPNLKFSRVISTRRARLDREAQQVETDFLRSIEQATRYRIRGDALRLMAGGSAILVFRSEAGSGGGGGAQQGRVTGTVTYRQRLALSPNAVVEVKLLDVSRADAPAMAIAEQTINPSGRQVPIAFELSYDRSRIRERGRYVIQARILEAGRLRFASTAAYPVITGGNPATVEVIVQPVGR